MELERARNLVFSSVRQLDAERVTLAECAGRYLAEPLASRRDVPPYRCAAMDGWAVRAGDARTLRRGATIWAGSAPGCVLAEGEAVRIFTGAPLPEGANAVIPQEMAREEGAEVRLPEVTEGANVRERGEDLRTGGLALEAGTRLGPRQLGMCVAAGVDPIVVVRRPRVAVVSTGDEIVAGLVPDSNGRTVAASVGMLGAAVVFERCGDDRETLSGHIAGALENCDALLTIGGASVGERDNLERVLREDHHAQILAHGVAMKPGKPFLFALCGGKPVFGLPGSPSACLVTFEVFARPALLTMCGGGRRPRRTLSLPLAEKIEGHPGRARFLWAELDAEGRARPLKSGGAQLRGPASADLLLALPAREGAFEAGARVEAWLLDAAA